MPLKMLVGRQDCLHKMFAGRQDRRHKMQVFQPSTYQHTGNPENIFVSRFYAST